MAFVEKKKNEAVLELFDRENGFKADVKFDGCVHFDIYNFDGHDDEDDESVLENPETHEYYIHICDIDQLTRALEEIKKAAKSHFGEDWY